MRAVVNRWLTDGNVGWVKILVLKEFLRLKLMPRQVGDWSAVNFGSGENFWLAKFEVVRLDVFRPNVTLGILLDNTRSL